MRRGVKTGLLLLALSAGACFAQIEMPMIGLDGESDSPCAPVQIPFRAEDFTIERGFELRDAATPEVDRMLVCTMDNMGSAHIELDIPCDDDWTMWSLARWRDGNSDSIFWAWDDRDARYVWHIMQQCGASIAPGWYWDQVTRSPVEGNCSDIDEDPAVFHLTEGRHTFYLSGREADAAVGLFVLTNEPSYTPD